eukprot:COSAG01_NODE_5897_length_3965_cov_2.372478_1_plen_47_part_00
MTHHLLVLVSLALASLSDAQLDWSPTRRINVYTPQQEPEPGRNVAT